MSRMGKAGSALMLVGFIALLADSGLFPERTEPAPFSFSEVPPATLGFPLNNGWGLTSAAHIPSEASAAYGLYIYSIDPSSGPLTGGTPVVLVGEYPVSAPITNVAAAEAAYSVFFDYVIPATFDGSVPQIVTATAMYVIAPPGIVVGPGDVLLLDDLDSNNFANVEDGFYYFDGIQIVLTSVFPVLGPLVGGQPVTLTGQFPVPAAVLTAAEAFSQYIVYFSYGNRANFDGLVPEVITTYSPPADNEMFVVTPPGPAPGFVDVWVIDANEVHNFGFLSLIYQYEDGIAEWSDVQIVTKDRSATIRPNDPVGRLDAGELEVRLTVAGTIGDAFIVPQGGNPANPAHRIDLEFSPSFTSNLPVLTLPDRLEVWTNTDPIVRIVEDNGAADESSGDLFADGHAAVYLIDLNGDIIGDDLIDLTDGGRILGDALTDRHFLIDATPPTMFVSVGGPEQADDFVLQLSNLNGGYTPTAANIGPGAFHPFPLPLVGDQSTVDAPIDLGTITDVPGTGNGAQIFMNVASLANDFMDEPLDIQVDVRFIDLSVHDTFGIALDPLFDTDIFDPSVTTRQVSGIDPTIEPNLPSGSDPEDTVRARLLESDHVQWVYRAGSDQLSPTGSTTVSTVHTVQAATDTGFWETDAGHPFQFTETTLDTQWVVNDIPQSSDKLHLALQFRAHDWAGSWADPSGDLQTDFTDADRLLDPVHIWWLRNTATRLFPNREGSEVFDPTFTLRLDNGFNTIANGLPPIYNYRIFVRNVDGKGAYDLPLASDAYDAFGPWTGWTTTSAIASGTFTGLAFENRWVLLVTVNTDEAGNVENWPADLTLDDNFTPADFSDDFVTDFLSGSGRNWQRFFVKGDEQEVETEVTAFFWHNDVPANNSVDVGELVFGETHVIPLPPRSAFDPNNPVSPVLAERVEARFVITAVTDIANPDIIWELLREGTSITGERTIVNPTDGIATVVVPLVDFPVIGFLGDPDRLRAISYVFRATTDAGGDRDSTPANFHFTVVPSVQGFIENRQTDDEQPIKVFERQ